MKMKIKMKDILLYFIVGVIILLGIVLEVICLTAVFKYDFKIELNIVLIGVAATAPFILYTLLTSPNSTSH